MEAGRREGWDTRFRPLCDADHAANANAMTNHCGFHRRFVWNMLASMFAENNAIGNEPKAPLRARQAA